MKYQLDPFTHCEVTLRTLLPKTDDFSRNITNEINNDTDQINKTWDLMHSEKTVEERLNYYNSVLENNQYEFTVKYHACELPDFIVLARSTFVSIFFKQNISLCT